MNQRRLVGGAIGGWAHCNGWSGINGKMKVVYIILKTLQYIHRFHNTRCAIRPRLHHYHISTVQNPRVCIVRILSCVCIVRILSCVCVYSAYIIVCVYSVYIIVCVCIVRILSCVCACVCDYVCVASQSPLFHKVFF
jgi:hypothetical protein